MPNVYVCFFLIWYTTQQFYVRWCNTYSLPFNVTNGVRQGGILSPFLFHIYMDDLSKVLNSVKAGCMINDLLFSHLIYADDLVLIALSVSALQTSLALCDC